MKFRSLLPALCMLLLGSLQVHGQSSKAHVYEDSSILYPAEATEDVDAPVEDQEQSNPSDEEEDAEQPFIRDTTLIRNTNALSADSVNLLKNNEQFAYAKVLDSLLQDLKKKQHQQESNPVVNNSPSWIERFFTSNITKYFFWILAIFFIGFIVVKLFMAGGFFQRPTARSRVKVLAEEEDLSPTRDSNFDVLIAKAKKENNYRLATRYLYLQLLQKLSLSGAIEFAADKTNSEYLRELTGKSYKQEVAQLTLNYEYVWYGEFLIDGPAYSRLENRFKNVNV